MLTAQEREYIEGRLLDLVANLPARMTLLAGMPQALKLRLNEGKPPYLLVKEAVALCEEDGYNITPPTLCTFITILIPNDETIKSICNRILLPPPASVVADPFEAVLLGRLPFLGRPTARAYLRSLLQDLPSQPIVVINGTRGAGKTYTTELIDHVCRTHQIINSCHVELKPEQGPSIGPAELAGDIVTLMGGDTSLIPKQGVTNLERWTQELANWVSLVAKNSGSKHWIVLDGFSNGELRQDTLLFIVKLAHVLTSGVARRLHRLILLDFDHTALPVPPGSIAHETIPGLSRAFVTNFVNDLVARSAGGLDAQAILTQIAEGLADPISDLRELGKRLNDLIEVVG
ncbi:hypothetical protein GGD66_002502 [Bradyrhizobium sp. CIR48]|uniref:hypothetical protein n=1 Tax=Bradyrhizobium sp. CIR48 TaxID=2663840 RepID=UPI001605FCD9|nr:hypothetical protein [Bradyrhizobium sp. CIR48]MBB4423958.1 hypothetical protein [Bradyrhizobium sp. CIR48]